MNIINFEKPYSFVGAVVFYFVSLALFYGLTILSIWIAISWFNVITETEITHISRLVSTVFVTFMSIKIYNDKSLDGFLAIFIAVAAINLVYATGLFVGFIPLSILTMLSAKSDTKSFSELGNKE